MSIKDRLSLMFRAGGYWWDGPTTWSSPVRPGLAGNEANTALARKC
ncbi:hypothetical protein ACFQ7G_24805 [Streptomyces massasporeus]